MSISFAPVSGSSLALRSRTVGSVLRATVATGALTVSLALHAPTAEAQVITYGYAFSDPDATNFAVSVVDRQVATGDLEAIVATGAVTSTLNAGGATIATTVSGNAIEVDVDANLTDPQNAADLFTVSSSGLIGGAALVQVQETGDGAADTDLFGRVTASAITQTEPAVGDGSSIALVGNVISADIGVNESVQTLQGDLNPDFDALEVGRVTSASADLTGFGAGFGIGMTGGLLAASSQIINLVDAETANAAGGAFSVVDANSSITTSVTGAYGDGLSITARDNTVEARFTGNDADNLISVGAGGDPLLASSAGILSLQNATSVGDGDAAGADRITALVDGSEIAARVDEDGQAFTDSSLTLAGNRVQAISTANLAENDIAIASGVDVQQPLTSAGAFEDQPQSNVVTIDRAAAALGDTLVAEGGLFVVSAQEAMDTDLQSIVQGGVTFTASVADDLSSATLSARDNDALALTTGNSATASIAAAGASRFDSVVTATNLQTFEASVGATEAPVITATVDAAGTAVVAGAAGDPIAASTVSVVGNDVRSQAVANASTTFDDVSNAFVPTISVAASDISAATTTPAGAVPAGVTLRETGLDGMIFGVTAGVSALSVQGVTGETGAPVVVTATTSDASTDLDVGGAGSAVTGSSFLLSESRLTASATLNTERMAVTLDASNSIDASSGIALAQDAVEAEARAVTSNAGVTADLGADGAVATGNSLVVGDADLMDGVFAGNAIEATALGQSGVTALNVSAGTTITVSDVIDTGTATPDSLALDVSNDLPSAAAAEMMVVTDQRLATAVVDATVTAPEITATVANGATDFGTAAAGNTIAVDGNRVAATARGNTVDNALSFDAASIDMSGADVADAQENMNLATLGAVQEIDQASGPIGATVDGAGSIAATVSGTGDVTGASISTDANTVSAFAAGNTATNALRASGSSLEVTGDAGAAALSIDAVDAADSDVELLAATVVGVLQSNAAGVTADIAAADQFAITTTAASTAAVTGSTLSADSNTALAQARNTSAVTATTLDYSTIESSAANAVRQVVSGVTSADLGGGGGVTITTSTGADSNIVGSTLTASSNTVGAETFAASSTSTLTATSATSLNAGSAATGVTTLEPGNTGAGEFIASVNADFASATQQVVSANATATADDMTVSVSIGDLGGATVGADRNLLTAQATGATETSTLGLSAATFGDTTQTPSASVLTDQRLSGGVTASLTASDVNVTVEDMNAVAGPGSDTVSVDANTISAVATGANAANTLTAAAAGAQGGDAAGAISLDLDGSDSASLLASATADQSVFSNQIISGNVLAQMADGATPQTRIGITQSGTGIAGDTLTVDGNTVLTQARGGVSANTLSSTSGTSSAASSSILANQSTTGSVIANAYDATVELTATSTVDASTLSLSSNAVRSSAANLTGGNTLTVDAGGAITGTAAGTGDIDGTTAGVNVDAVAAFDAAIVSNQSLGANTADVEGRVADIAVSMDVTGAVGGTAGATLLVDANTIAAGASGASDVNALTLSSDNALTSATAGVLQQQNSVGNVSALNSNVVVNLGVVGAVTASTASLSDNTLSATASNLTAANTLTADAGTSATGTGTVTNTLTTANRTGAATTLADTVGDRVIATDQFVNAAAGVVANTFGSPTVALSISGAVTGNSAVTADDNVMASSATVASVSNTLSNVAGTSLTAGAGVASIQESAAAATATVLDGDVTIALGAGVTDGAVSLGSNELTATARGLQATNSLTASAATIDGGAAEAFSTASVPATSDWTLANTAFSQLSSVQQQSGAVTASVSETAGNESAELTVAVTGAVATSTVGVDANAVTAQAVGVSGANTLSQTASGAIAVGSGANLASVQEIGGGATGADVTGLTMGTTVTTTVGSSTLSVDDNAVLAAATGGTAANALSVSAGTSVTGGGDLTLVNDAGDTTAATLVQTAAGDAVLGSTQLSSSAVAAVVQPGDDGTNPDEFPTANLDVDGAVTASTLSVDGNSFRALGTNLTASNTLSVEADTAITSYGAAVANLQEVNAATTGTVSGAAATLSVGGTLSGVASVSDNMMVAAGAGGAATNSLSLAAADLTGGAAATAVSADLQGANSAPITASGADLASGVSNIQARNGAVTAQLTDGDGATANGSLLATATLTGAVTGSVAVDDNMLLAQARGLSATSGLTATLDNALTDASLNVSSLQEAEGGAVTAAINAGSTAGDDDARIAITASGTVTGTTSLDGNVAQAAALTNLATNTLSVTAAGGVSVGTETAATIGVTNPQDLDAATIGLSVMNGQLATAGTVATIDNLDIETAITGALTGTATVDGNRVIGDARGNFATNALTVDAANGLTASTALLNSQQSDAAADVSTTINATGSLGRIGLTASNAVTGTASVSGNMVQGNAVVNQAVNSMALDAATLATAGGGSATAGSAGTADFVALNSQTSAADATSLVQGYTIGATLSPAGAFSGTARVDGNMILASAGGNLASNVFTLDAAGNSRGDFAAASLQSNTGAISARIASMTVNLNAGGAATAAGTFSLDGNRIGATAQGNVAITTLGRSTSGFSNF